MKGETEGEMRCERRGEVKCGGQRYQGKKISQLTDKKLEESYGNIEK
jgi:hypothetical protein